MTLQPGAAFHFDVHVFYTSNPELDGFIQVFSVFAQTGLGTGRGAAELLSVDQFGSTEREAVWRHGEFLFDDPRRPVTVSLAPGLPCSKVRVRFITPTELKGGARLIGRPKFGVLFARIRDRLSALSALYGPGPLEIDFRSLGDRARAIRMTSCDVRFIDALRRSSKTGQTHGIGGFAGEAVYEGEIAEFVPYLEAARWTGVGRHTVWGKGVIEVEILNGLLSVNDSTPSQLPGPYSRGPAIR